VPRHPWELTLREFVEKVRRDYGIEVKSVAVREDSRYLKREGLLFALPGITEDDILSLDLLRGLCKFYDLPPVDFALDPDVEEE
jgi:hypothetical protein